MDVQQDVQQDNTMKTMSKGEIRREKCNIMKNICLISVAWMLVFNVWNGLSRLQSSLHRDNGMGTTNVSVLHAALMISCLTTPKLVINKIGYKNSMMLGLFMYLLWAGANGYAVWGTMITASVLVGLFAGPMWTAQRSYFSILGSRYAALTKEDDNIIIARFLGIFFCFGNLGVITASVISSTVLHRPPQNISEEALGDCGIQDCPEKTTINTNEHKPPQQTVWILLIVYIVIAIIGLLLIVILVDRLPKWLIKEETEKGTKKETKNFISATFKQMLNKKQIALTPLTMYLGIEQSTFGAEFTKSYVTCSIGIWQIGYITIPFAVMSAFVCLLAGRLVKLTGRVVLFTVGFAIDLGIQVTLMTWMPEPSQTYVFHIIAIAWGISDALWQTQIPAMYAVIFPDLIPAFAVNSLFIALGYVLAFGYSTHLCTDTKLRIVMGLYLLSALGYYITEYCVRHEGRHEEKDAENIDEEAEELMLKKKGVDINHTESEKRKLTGDH